MSRQAQPVTGPAGIVRPHTCAHAAQDQIHGPGNRVWNATKGGRRCTVCGVEVIDGRTALVRAEGPRARKEKRQ